MADEKVICQFDSKLGGAEVLPNEVHIIKFAAARSKEMATMSECILNPCSTKLIFQSLPIHMRRRVMSHNSKRLPRRLRLAHESQLKKSGVPSRQKRPSRKYRRRPQNLLKEYNRRQKNYVWLETHIWHAKRFHMTEEWGYKLPLAPCDKNFRACYRASTNHCLIQDLSYYVSLQISGKIDDLIAGFKKITNPKCGLSITAAAYLNSTKEGSASIFEIDSYPLGYVGKITFFWKQSQNYSNSLRTLWIFVHPAFYDQFKELLIKCFKLNVDDCIEKYDDGTLAKRRKTEDSHKVDKINKILANNDNCIKILELKDKINRFRMTGPLSHAILSKSLIPTCVDANKETKLNPIIKEHNWFDEITNDEVSVKVHKDQSSFWNKFCNIKSPAELPCNLIVGLNVKDPRITFPTKRTKAVPADECSLTTQDYITMPDHLSHSHLWEENVREKVSQNFISNLEMNKLREKYNLVPGTCSHVFNYIPDVPVLLIQRPGSQNSQNKRLGYNCGWDIIIPSGYGMAFWVSFILRGARVGGLRETLNMSFESGLCDTQPDSLASQKQQLANCKKLCEKFFKLPPKKRVNFMKLSINSPFLCRWQILCNDWKPEIEKKSPFYVIRERTLLITLQEIIKTKNIPLGFDCNTKALVPVKLTAIGKGRLRNFGLICLPNDEDSVSLQLIEPKKKDVNQHLRKQLRSKHKTLLMRLRRKHVRNKRKITDKTDKYIGIPKQNNRELIDKYLSEMKELWLPSQSQIKNVRNQCSREVMGYITRGDFSLTEGRGYGIGYVTLQTIFNIVKVKINSNRKHGVCFVLTRNPMSLHYRYANMEIICDY